jgi:hypothetical protein
LSENDQAWWKFGVFLAYQLLLLCQCGCTPQRKHYKITGRLNRFDTTAVNTNGRIAPFLLLEKKGWGLIF